MILLCEVRLRYEARVDYWGEIAASAGLTNPAIVMAGLTDKEVRRCEREETLSFVLP